MRLFKSEAEAKVMKKAADISMKAHERAMKFTQPGKFEYQLQAELEHEFLMQGARAPAYGTIVGSGENGCILHYTENADVLNAGDLILIDAGAEFEGYAADITRTFPVSGKFSQAQRALYQIVLDAQLAALEHIKPGVNFKVASDVAIKVITQGLLDLEILNGSLEDCISLELYRQFYMHGLGHWLGLDVHDQGNYKVDGQDRLLEAGMVLTIEPGIYISPKANVDDKWKGIGIRIEDDVLVTNDGHENLTAKLPKTIHDIEALMASIDS
jgi:Xaa-Pro aminopeptidase